MKNMEEYGIIYIDTHGGVVNSRYGKELDFVVGQKGNEQLYEKYASDLNNHYLAHAWIPAFSLSHYFAILPHFIWRYAETSYPNSLIYIDACNSYKNPSMAAAFVEEGAYVYCGYSSFIMAWNYSEQTVFDNMIDEAMTIQEAVNEVGASNLHFHPGEGGNFYLGEDDEEAEILKVLDNFGNAIVSQNWAKAKSYCVVGSEQYKAVDELEDLYDELSTLCNDINFSCSGGGVTEVTISGKFAEVSGYSSCTVSCVLPGGEEISVSGGGDATIYLEKIGDSWKIYKEIAGDYTTEENF